MRRSVVKGPGQRLSALRGTPRPIVWLHGLNLHAYSWVPFLERAGGVALDLRGHGRSESPSDGYWTGALAADVAVACAGLGLRRFVLVGHAFAARVALAFAAMYPDAVERLVLIEGGVDLTPEGQASLVARMEAFPDAFPSAAAAMAAFRAAYPSIPEVVTRAVVRHGLRKDGTWHSPRHARVAIARQWNLVKGLELARLVRCPTQVVRADDSFHWTESQARDLAAAIPGGARMVAVPGSHYVVQDNPDGLWEAIRHEGLA